MKLYIKYMVSLRCKMMVKEELKKLGLHCLSIDLGMVEIQEVISKWQHEQLSTSFLSSSLTIILQRRLTIYLI